MRLASDEITIRLAGEAIHLRPTLRAAFRLERRYKGFEQIVRGLADGNLTIAGDVVRESTDKYTSIPGLLECLDDMPLQKGMEALIDPLIQHVFALAGFDKENEPGERGATSKLMSFADYHEKLFGIATGWLGWSPDTAWDATAAEILSAYSGKLDMLAAIFGSGKDKGAGHGTEPDFERDEKSWTRLKLLTASGANKAA
jgi:hypothetical protein